MPLTKEKGVIHGEEPSNYVSEEEHREQRIKFTQRYISSLQRQKKQEKEQGNLETGRRRWFNTELEKQRQKLEELIKKESDQ